MEAAEARAGRGRGQCIDTQRLAQAQRARHVQRVTDDDHPVQVALIHQPLGFDQVLHGVARGGLDQDRVVRHAMLERITPRHLRFGKARAGAAIAASEDQQWRVLGLIEIQAMADAFFEHRGRLGVIGRCTEHDDGIGLGRLVTLAHPHDPGSDTQQPDHQHHEQPPQPAQQAGAMPLPVTAQGAHAQPGKPLRLRQHCGQHGRRGRLDHLLEHVPQQAHRRQRGRVIDHDHFRTRRAQQLEVGGADQGTQAIADRIRGERALARAGEVDGIVTAPLNKAAMHAAGHKWPGHTELLAHEFRVKTFSLRRPDARAHARGAAPGRIVRQGTGPWRPAGGRIGPEPARR
ncbi:hypothetical protein G6F59_013202 [Rhizopus arrhizus]|nr:hypothetical protein G6F59_013202 [Rhizopus arrhizus]